MDQLTSKAQVILALALTVIPAVGALIYSQRKRNAGEPPLLAGLIPYVGVATEYGKDAGAFLDKARAEHGPIITIYLAGRRMTFILDPMAVPAFYRNRILQWENIEIEVMHIAFLSDVDVYKQVHHELRTQYRYLAGEHLAALRDTFQSAFEQVLLQAANTRSADSDGWIAANLTSDVCRWFFDANLMTVFGEGFDMDEIFDDFVTFDKGFPLAAAGAPPMFLRECRDAQRRLIAAFAKRYSGPAAKENTSLIMQKRVDAFSKTTGSPEELGKLQTSLLWAAQANTFPSVFWTLLHILTHPEIRTAVEKEIAAAQNPTTGSSRLNLNVDAVPLLDACINESLRLASSSYSIRSATETQDVDIGDGNIFRVRKGDRVVVPSSATHYGEVSFLSVRDTPNVQLLIFEVTTDADIYPGPEKYDPYRWMPSKRPDGTLVPPVFQKDGKAVRQNHLPFGGGSTLCPGRFLARSEIKVVVSTLLSAMDIRLSSEKVPSFDRSRFGFGILPPVGDAPFEFRLKNGVLVQ
ncbi:hypothetical protein HK104_008268 [Borealophlyctis nickersoniae]|nr:hypothetical protein HK104_008268 [Borealophlyctis nickersoniae]